MTKKHEALYKDDDLLSPKQAAEVISENSGYTVSDRYMARLVQLGLLKAPRAGRYHDYPYHLVKDYVVHHKSPGRKPLPDDVAKPRSVYHRGYMRLRRERERSTQEEERE